MIIYELKGEFFKLKDLKRVGKVRDFQDINLMPDFYVCFYNESQKFYQFETLEQAQKEHQRLVIAWNSYLEGELAKLKKKKY